MKKKIILASLVILGIILMAFVGCGGGKSSSDAEKMIGKWTDKDGMGFTVEIKKENGKYILMRGNPEVVLTVENGYYDEETKRLIFVEEDKPSRKPHEFWYDSENDEIFSTFQSGGEDKYKRVEE